MKPEKPSPQGWLSTAALPLQVIGILSALILALNFCLEILALLALQRDHQLLLLALLISLAVWAILEAAVLRARESRLRLHRLLGLLMLQLGAEGARLGLVFWGLPGGIDRAYGIGTLNLGPLPALLPIYVALFLAIGRAVIASHTAEIASAYRTILQMEDTALKLTQAISVGTYTLMLKPGESLWRFVFVSPRFLRLMGVEGQDQAVLRDPLIANACVHPEDAAAWERLHVTTCRERRALSGRTRLIVDSAIRWVSAEAIPRELADGSTIWEGVLIDITDSVLAQEAIESANRAFTEIEVERSRLHERTRLLQDVHDGFGSQLASARLRMRHGALPATAIDELLRECQDDLHLVVDTLGNEALSLRDALVDFRHRCQKRLAYEPLRITWDLRLTGCPPIENRQTLQMLRILQEALNNAVKHSQAREIRIEAVYLPTRQIQLSVSDDGVGIPDEVRAGRGLANMRSRARDLGAQFRLESLSPGTRVTINLPVTALREPAAA
jgi:signal transduction histidine kinase